jgi:hypothetical protein
MHYNIHTVDIRVGAQGVVLTLEIASTCSVATSKCSSDACGVLYAGLVASVEAGLIHASVIAAIDVHSTCQDERARVCTCDGASVVLWASVASRTDRGSRSRCRRWHRG